MPPAGVGSPPPLPPVQIGAPGYKFKFPAESAEGQDERREHERIRKSNKRAAHKAAEPPPLPAPPVVDALQAPAGEQGPGVVPPVAPVAVEIVPWLGQDIADFTDELVELAEVKRVNDFVEIAKNAKLPAKLIAEIEKRSHYPTNSKAALKRCLADCVAKWLNRTGVSSANKEEVKILFCMVTLKLQGLRLKKDLLEIIEADKATKAKASAEAPPPAATETPPPAPSLKEVLKA